MIIASLNVNGVGSTPKKKWVRRLCNDNHLSFIGIQESKSCLYGDTFIHSLWGNNMCDFAVKNLNGNSGGIIAIWGSSMFKRQTIIDKEDGFLAIYGEWLKDGIACLMFIVYAPHDRKTILWNRLTDLLHNFLDMSIVLGDFKEVRCEMERMGCNFSRPGALRFNGFINDSGLLELPVGGKKFTRMNRRGTKLSKLDLIFITHHFISSWPNANLLALPCDLSDHCPIILKTQFSDYGPIPRAGPEIFDALGEMVKQCPD
ncbi:cytochrome P450 [Tanacetum coccineum]